jgi:hypothetical protein
VAVQLVASQEGLSSMELDIIRIQEGNVNAFQVLMPRLNGLQMRI